MRGKQNENIHRGGNSCNKPTKTVSNRSKNAHFTPPAIILTIHRFFPSAIITTNKRRVDANLHYSLYSLSLCAIFWSSKTPPPTPPRDRDTVRALHRTRLLLVLNWGEDALSRCYFLIIRGVSRSRPPAGCFYRTTPNLKMAADSLSLHCVRSICFGSSGVRTVTAQSGTNESV